MLILSLAFAQDVPNGDFEIGNDNDVPPPSWFKLDAGNCKLKDDKNGPIGGRGISMEVDHGDGHCASTAFPVTTQALTFRATGDADDDCLSPGATIELQPEGGGTALPTTPVPALVWTSNQWNTERTLDISGACGETWEIHVLNTCGNNKKIHVDGFAQDYSRPCDQYVDVDQDGFCPNGIDVNGDGDCAGPLDVRSATIVDCDETGPDADRRSVGIPEACDGIDNDCDDLVDDGLPVVVSWADADGDGEGDPATQVDGCDVPPGRVDNDLDCNDADDTINTLAVEDCDGTDSNCSGDESDAIDAVSVYPDVDLDGVGAGAVAVDGCDVSGWSTVTNDCAPTEPDVHPGATEVCNDVDDDCDGATDEDLQTYYSYVPDPDGDGYALQGAATVESCHATPPPGHILLRTDGYDCDENAVAIHPGAPDTTCNGVDEDCSGIADDGPGVVWTTWHPDADGDGFGDPDPLAALSTCDGAPAGYIQDDTDCLDDPANALAAFAHPGAVEYCDGVDNDCDLLVDSDDDDHVTSTWWPDGDGDGFGDGDLPSFEACMPTVPAATNGGDCDDTDPNVSPLALDEDCDGVDDDCNGTADDAAPFVDVYLDADADGYAGPFAHSEQCPEAGAFLHPDDCNDADASVHPGIVDDDCDDLDDDCDGVPDDDAPSIAVYQDLDGDGHAGDTTADERCPEVEPVITDCDDGRADVFPGAPESCNAVDADCDGIPGEEQVDCPAPPPVAPPPDSGCGCSQDPGRPAWLFGLLRRR